jgi:hypothetical protein
MIKWAMIKDQNPEHQSLLTGENTAYVGCGSMSVCTVLNEILQCVYTVVLLPPIYCVYVVNVLNIGLYLYVWFLFN